MNPNHIGTNFDDFLKEEGIIMDDRFKFRVWNKEQNRFHHSFCCDITASGTLVISQGIEGKKYIVDDDNYVVQQCTGLKDKNGKLIYEGDIVKMNNYILQIVYNKDYACFCAENKNLFGYFRELRHIDAFEVIGNIYENKELLNDR